MCCGCGESTCAELPDGVPTSTAGPRLVALTAMLMGCFRQSKRRVALFLEQILGQPCSPGWVVKLQHQTTAALRPGYEQLAAQLPAQAHVSLDETPSKEGPTKTWLWTCVAKQFTVFALRATRVRRGGTARRDVRRRGHLRSGESLLCGRRDGPLAMVLGALETRFSRTYRRRGPAGEAARPRPD
ncbi:MAG: hypothetical protein DCC68_13245, partial [Planctomycetota bacterium]